MKRLFLLSITIFCFFKCAYAQPGELDPSFGTNGIVKINIGEPYIYSGKQAAATQVLTLPDGSLYVIQNYLTKRHADGSFDLSFGADGIASFPHFFIDKAAIAPNGKIVVKEAPGGGIVRYNIARYNIDGSLDSSFSGDGILTTFFCRALAVQNDGKILLAGQNYNSASNLVVERYNEDGSLDNTFNNGERSIENSIYPQAIAIQQNGKILIVGNKNDDFAILRYNSDGSPDNTFGSEGIQTTDVSGYYDNVSAIVIQKDGKIVAAGSSYDNTSCAIVRYNTDGSLDTTFIDEENSFLTLGQTNSVALQADGKIVIAGRFINFSD